MTNPPAFPPRHALLQSQKQTQRMIMSPQMQQAIKFLLVPIMELSQVIDMEIETNPILERSEEPDEDSEYKEEAIEEFGEEPEISDNRELDFEKENFDFIEQINEDYNDFFHENDNYSLRTNAPNEKLRSFLENSLSSKESIGSFLHTQAKEIFTDPNKLAAAEIIIGSIMQDGFFTENLEELSLLTHIPSELLQTVLEEMRSTFDPPGIGAADCKECLLLQLERKNKTDSLAYRIIALHFKNLLENKIGIIAASLHKTPKEIIAAVSEEISCLDLHPGASLDNGMIQPIIPDLFIFLNERDVLEASVSKEFIPSFKINKKYLKMINDPSIQGETKEFIKQKITSAKWLMKSLLQRNDTLQRLGELLILMQNDFLAKPNGRLIPMSMKSFAEKLSLHESTIARAVTNKYLACDRGIFPLRYFFTAALSCDDGPEMSSKSVKEMIGDMIREENSRKPLSDEALSLLLKNKGVSCARRTVAKYRNQLKMGNARQRKKFT